MGANMRTLGGPDRRALSHVPDQRNCNQTLERGFACKCERTRRLVLKQGLCMYYNGQVLFPFKNGERD